MKPFRITVENTSLCSWTDTEGGAVGAAADLAKRFPLYQVIVTQLLPEYRVVKTFND